LGRLDHLEASALQSLFEELNQTFFQAHLPRYRVIYGPPPGESACSGYCDPKAQTMYVEPRPPTPAELRRKLLHEMCHVGSLGHGKRFQAKLRQLATLGEAWAAEEAEKYAEMGHHRPVTARSARAIRDAADEFLARHGLRSKP